MEEYRNNLRYVEINGMRYLVEIVKMQPGEEFLNSSLVDYKRVGNDFFSRKIISAEIIARDLKIVL